jgi:allene oxide cyclase
VFAIGGIAVLLVAVAAWAKQPGKPHPRGGKTITVIEHATSDATTDTGAPGDSAGDVLTFAK